MELRDIAQSAAMVGWYGTRWTPNRQSKLQSSMNEFWRQSRLLFRRWADLIGDQRKSPTSLYDLVRLFEEVVSTEILTRTVSCELLVESERNEHPEAAKLAFQLMSQHYKYRDQLLKLIEAQPDSTSTLLRCERFIRKIERWCDLLISRTSEHDSALHAAFDTDRFLDFGDDWNIPSNSENRDLAFQMQIAALSVCIPKGEIIDEQCLVAHQGRLQAALNFVSREHVDLIDEFTLNHQRSHGSSSIPSYLN